ncbi:tripartite tricarboxylate transporter substrate-binding protein [Roseicella aquatilis]|uniref:Twin-arginine translocation pathway signal protein n=1 Tax=Roseicella aquatilis TaxID=2527868 RepID=A0A4V2WK58_9PROT|nr:tripartite tricarboxylate transporter substrate-binding protein [Roseicella aquatilis]TCZ57209.1 twin-arginine translocation pathway signal protein [Roseicella aquatilis]
MTRHAIVTGRRALLAAALAAGPARAAWVPPRPVRLVVPFPPGGGADTTARLLAPVLSAFLGQPAVVENRAGAGGTIGAQEVARSAPDGATLLVDAANQAVAPSIFRNLAFDYATAFTPISRVTLYPLVLAVRADSRLGSLGALLDRARAQPGRLTYASSGNAVANHIATALLASRAGVEFTHAPYRGGGAALQAVLAGEVEFGFATVASAAGAVQQGLLRPLAVSTAGRVAALPAAPTVAEQGFPGFDQAEWNGVYGPAGLGPEALARIHGACLAALADPGVQQRLAAIGAIGLGTEPAHFADFLRRERAAMEILVREARITAD